MPAFIYMIQKFHPPKPYPRSPFMIFVQLQKNLEIDDIDSFFKHFLPIFESGVKDDRYQMQHVTDFIRSMGRRDHTIDNYLSIYSLHVDIQQLWEMFLYLSKG
ncbi:unnamed protein product, partial [Rotaria sp. Silwood2]